MARRKNYKAPSWAANNPDERTFIQLYESMVLSETWYSLSAKQQALYIYMKYHSFNSKNRPDDCQIHFYFNREVWKNKYKLYKNPTQFNKDMKALCKAGFIEVLESGKITRTKNKYSLSDKWKY